MENVVRRTAFAACAIVALGAASAFAQAEKAPDEMTGIKVSEKAPEFTLKDQNGAEVSLADLTKKSRVALIFYRSANW